MIWQELAKVHNKGIAQDYLGVPVRRIDLMDQLSATPARRHYIAICVHRYCCHESSEQTKRPTTLIASALRREGLNGVTALEGATDRRA
jgi:hypothetical protein